MNTNMDIENFIHQFKEKTNEEQEIIQMKITKYLINKKNKTLFEKIKKHIFDETDDFIKNFCDFKNLTKIIEKYGNKNIVEFLKNEFDEFTFNFNSKKLLYSYEIEFEVQFKNFKYCYTDEGDIANYGYNISCCYEFDDLLNDDMQKIIKLLVCEDYLKDNCWTWLNDFIN